MNSLFDVSNGRASTVVQSLFQGSYDFGSQDGETWEGAMKAWSSDYSSSVQTDSLPPLLLLCRVYDCRDSQGSAPRLLHPPEKGQDCGSDTVPTMGRPTEWRQCGLDAVKGRSACQRALIIWTHILIIFLFLLENS